MTIEIRAFRNDAAVVYSTVLSAVADVLPSSFEHAQELLAPIAGEVWMGKLTLHGKTVNGVKERSSRAVPNRVRAQVFLRDGFLCSHCGNPTIPRNIFVALSDVFPEGLPYNANYRRGATHPAYWALAPEADHTLAHANGGSSEIDNLTTMHAMCNTRKSSLAVDSLPAVTAAAVEDRSWDGLLSRYADIIVAGNSHGRRHSRPGYHLDWLRDYGLLEDRARLRLRAAEIG